MVQSVGASKDENLLLHNTVWFHYSNKDMLYLIHLEFSVIEVQMLMVTRKYSWNFGKRRWKKIS